MIGRVGLGAVALLAAPSVHAQEKAETPLHAAVGAPGNLKLSGTFRAQIEGIDEQFRPNAARDDRLLTFRTTIAAEYDTGPVRFGAELWDARGYLEKRDSSAGTSEVNALELVQAYVGLDLNSDTTLDAGRMTLDRAVAFTTCSACGCRVAAGLCCRLLFRLRRWRILPAADDGQDTGAA